MSYTTVLAAFEDGDMVAFDNFTNSWHAAMTIWTYISKKYLNWDSVPFNGDELEKLWDLAKDESVTVEDKLLLLTTFDNAVVGPDAAEAVASVLESFPKATMNTKGQAEAIREAIASGAKAIAWQQTSCGDNLWRIYNEEEESGRPYNIFKDKSHKWIRINGDFECCE